MSDSAADQLFLGRQPILDRDQRLFAYELLFRSGSRNFAEVTDGVQATATVIAIRQIIDRHAPVPLQVAQDGKVLGIRTG